MKVASFSLHDTEGGAARAAFRLHTGLRACGFDSQMFVRRKSSDDANVIAPISAKDFLRNSIARRLDELPLKQYPKRRPLHFSTAQWRHGQIRRSDCFAPDILHLHWINAGYIGINDLFGIRTPIVWTMHDMWPITGGCHHAEDCNAYQGNCGRCPQLGSTTAVDLSRKILARKRKAWENLDLCWVTPSRWLAEKVRKSSLVPLARIETIPNGIDTQRFSRVDKQFARQLLGLPPEKKIVLFGAVNATSNPWKGYQHLRNIVQALAQRRTPVQLAVFGASAPPQADTPFAIDTHYLGSYSDELSLAIIYAAADIFIAPSTEDNLPNTVMEAMSCGTPVVAFRIGGMADMVEDGVTGALIDPFDCLAFAEAIEAIVGNPRVSQDMSFSARAKVEREFALPIVASRYIELYKDVYSARR